jgi:hypothetical protein
LTFQQFIKQYKVVPLTAEETDLARQEESDSPDMTENNLVQAEPQAEAIAVEEASPSAETPQLPSPADKTIGDTKPTKKLTKAELAQQIAEQEREQLLRQVGQELRQARLERSLSVFQLHSQTLVPIHHIEALESGCLEHLPEDVYIRGFIRRIAHALGLDGMTMTASIPEPDPVKSVVPSWYRAPSTSSMPGFQLNSVHLYLGYTALIAGAVGGLSWMSNKSVPGASVTPEPTGSSQTSMSPKAQGTESNTKPGLKASKTGVKAGSDIAPPEAF